MKLELHRSRRAAVSLALLVFLSLSIACSPSNSKVVGHWKSGHVTMDITKEGDNYIVKAVNPDAYAHWTFSGPYKDGRIVVGGQFGDVTYAQERDTVMWAGSEYTRADIK
jgi:hypothetical protein